MEKSQENPRKKVDFMVRRLRKEVNELQLKLVELQTEEELQAEEMPLQ